MTSWFHVLLLAQSLAAAHAPAGSNPKDDLTKPFQLDPARLFLTVGADGKASDIACAPAVSPALCPTLAKGVSAWTFAPGKRHGQPDAILCELTLELVAVPKPGGFGVQATRAHLRSATRNADGSPDMAPVQLTPPHYPAKLLGKKVVGRVDLEMWMDPGAVHPRVGKMWLDGKPSDGTEEMVRAVVDAVRTWPAPMGAPELRMACHNTDFVLEGKPVAPIASPCKSVFDDGFTEPRLVTDPTTASF